MTSEIESNPQILSTIAFSVLRDAEALYKEEKKFSPETLQSLHSIFGNVLVRAMELLENGHVIRYESKTLRRVLKVENRTEHYTLFSGINFCHCQAFKYQVLHTRNALTCKHVLVAKLAEISGQIKLEIIEDRYLVDLLNGQIEEGQ